MLVAVGFCGQAGQNLISGSELAVRPAVHSADTASYGRAGWLRAQSDEECSGKCAPYGLSVRVNAKEALPDELKYKDWGASGSERIKLNLTPHCLMAGLPGNHHKLLPVVFAETPPPNAASDFPAKVQSLATPRWLHQFSLLSCSPKIGNYE